MNMLRNKIKKRIKSVLKILGLEKIFRLYRLKLSFINDKETTAIIKKDNYTLKTVYNYFEIGKSISTDQIHLRTRDLTLIEINKTPSRTEVINFLLKQIKRETNYLEIGTRDPADNFNKINSANKFSVDPGVEFPDNPVDFQMTSDDFFDSLKNNRILDNNIRFDVIFIDGLHQANQVERDIEKSLDFISDDGFIVLHDCNPPTEYHSREDFYYTKSPALYNWNGTTWKAFYKYRLNKDLTSCCVDCDWGVGVISKKKFFNYLPIDINSYYEYSIFDKYRQESLNLIDFSDLQNIFKK
jgi:hypothetical protein